MSRMSGTPISFSHGEIESGASSQAVVISDLTPPESETDPIDRAEQIAAFLTRTQARVVVFCQEQKACSFFTGKNQEVFRYLRPITLYMGNETHQIMIYTKEPSIMETAETFHCEKELPYTGVTIRMDGISASEASITSCLSAFASAITASPSAIASANIFCTDSTRPLTVPSSTRAFASFRKYSRRIVRSL